MKALPLPAPIRAHLAELIRTRWSAKDPQPVIDGLPDSMPPGVVAFLVRGGPFGWLIEARLDEIDARVALECLEDSRMAGPDHYRVWEDGTLEALPNEHIAYATPPNCSPEERERIEAAYYAHNGRVQELLRERGFRR